MKVLKTDNPVPLLIPCCLRFLSKVEKKLKKKQLSLKAVNFCRLNGCTGRHEKVPGS